RQLELRLRLPGGPLQVFVDRDKVMQVFTNLLNNAIKYTPQGSIEITLVPEHGEVLCGVADTGPGIAPADVPKLFGKFQQLGTRAAHGEKGTGLGLSICKGIVELHQGKIWVES